MTGWPVAAIYGLGALSSYLVLAWSRDFSWVWLIAAVVAASGAGVVALLRAGSWSGRGLERAALVVLVGSLLTGAAATWRFQQITFDWPAPADASMTAARSTLARQMADVVDRGRRAARLAAAVTDTGVVAFTRLQAIHASTGVDAVALFDASEPLRAWAGDHRGTLPDRARGPGQGAFFNERPLFNYLYFKEPMADGSGVAVAAVLIDTDQAVAPVDGGGRAGPGRDLDVAFRAGGGGAGADWSLIEEGDTVVHARIAPITQASLRRSTEATARRIAVVLCLLALGLFGAAWLRRFGAHPAQARTAVPLLAFAVGLAVAPIGTALGLDPLFEPSVFVLPIPGDVSLAGFAAPVAALAALVATLRPPPLLSRRYLIALVAGSLAVTLAYPAMLRVLVESSSGTFLQGGLVMWLGLQGAAVLVLSGVTVLALPRGRPGPHAASRVIARPFVAGGGVLLALALALLVMWRVDPREGGTPWTAALWLGPFLLLAAAFTHWSGRRGALTRWLCAGTLAATAVLSHLSVAETHARLEAAREEVLTIAQLPPIVEFLLVEFGEEAKTRYRAGERDLLLLYRSWVGSGLAREPYGVRITLWGSDGSVEAEVALGGAEGSDAQSAVVRRQVADSRGRDGYTLNGLTGEPGISKIYTTGLGDGRVVSVSVPPRSTFERVSVLASFLGSTPRALLSLNLVQDTRGELPHDDVHWDRTVGGYRSDFVVRFPDGIYHAHSRVRTTSAGVRLARGTLLAAFDLSLLVLLWFVGSLARGLAPVAPGSLTALAASFRVRVTLALFVFFLVPTALFGVATFRAYAGEVERASTTIAARIVERVAREFEAGQTNLGRLSQNAGAEVLYFIGGELSQSSTPEARRLGVFSAWLPPDLYQLLRSGEERAIQDTRRLGAEQYVIAYHQTTPAGLLAVPMPVARDEAATRQNELADVILFAALMGALLSFALSLAVGRTLAGPIGRLRRAAAAVGAGRLRVRLPETQGDEFGDLYASFNRMVRRLRRARTRERETARVLAWGEMARQVAHEIKNPLTPIKLSVQHLRRAHRDQRPDFGPVLEESVEQILDEIDRLTEIARAFSRYGAPEENAPLESVPIRDVVREALTLYRAADDAIAYRDDVPADVPAVLARKGEMKEVLLNLVENARQALEDGGTITVRAVAADGRVDLSVEDDGPGIAPDLLPRVFDPHFSTRSTGTGLGLAIVRRLVESWGGSVTAQSEPGFGTAVRMRLQAAADGQRAR